MGVSYLICLWNSFTPILKQKLSESLGIITIRWTIEVSKKPANYLII